MASHIVVFGAEQVIPWLGHDNDSGCRTACLSLFLSLLSLMTDKCHRRGRGRGRRTHIR
jgi:hypothetical protein